MSKHEAQRQAFIAKFFPVAAKHCNECKKRIGTKKSPRRRIATLEEFGSAKGRALDVGAYQLCVTCAENLLAQKMHLLPNIVQGAKQAQELYSAQAVGGVQ